MKWFLAFVAWVASLVALPFLWYALDEERVAWQIASEVEQFAQAHGGRAPQSWEELAPASTVKETARVRYAFLEKPVTFVMGSGAKLEVVMMIRRPHSQEIMGETEFGYWTIGRVVNDWKPDDIYSTFLGEKWVQQTFREAGVALPPPEAGWRGFREPLVFVEWVVTFIAAGLGLALLAKFLLGLSRLLSEGIRTKAVLAKDGKPARTWEY